MPSNTSQVLGLPYIQPSQAQKHVTHNEALKRLDVLVQLVVSSRTTATPPSAPPDGRRHVVPGGATGDWADQDGKLAVFQNGAWIFIDPLVGWQAYVKDEDTYIVFTNTGWAPLSTQIDFQNLDMVGINTTADATNRLSAASEATLLTHDGDDHRLKINKAAASDTASLLFQTGFSGRAEMGTTGSDGFSIKTSPDGSTWVDALMIDSATGKVGLGTSTPNYALQIHRPGTAGSSIQLSNGSSGSGASDGFWFGYSNAAYFWNYEATNTQFGTSNTARMTITADGDVGIGTVTPGCALDVVGAVRAGSYASGSRPSPAAVGAGAQIYDTTLSKPIWSDGTNWRDASGTVV